MNVSEWYHDDLLYEQRHIGEFRSIIEDQPMIVLVVLAVQATGLVLCGAEMWRKIPAKGVVCNGRYSGVWR